MDVHAGERLKEYQETTGLNNSQITDAIEISKPAINRLYGLKSFDARTILMFWHKLGIAPSFFGSDIVLPAHPKYSISPNRNKSVGLRADTPELFDKQLGRIFQRIDDGLKNVKNNSIIFLNNFLASSEKANPLLYKYQTGIAEVLTSFLSATKEKNSVETKVIFNYHTNPLDGRRPFTPADMPDEVWKLANDYSNHNKNTFIYSANTQAIENDYIIIGEAKLNETRFALHNNQPVPVFNHFIDGAQSDGTPFIKSQIDKIEQASEPSLQRLSTQYMSRTFNYQLEQLFLKKKANQYLGQLKSLEAEAGGLVPLSGNDNKGFSGDMDAETTALQARFKRLKNMCRG